MRTLTGTFAVLLLCGCGSIPPTSATGPHITTQHGTARFQDALAGAQEYCARRGQGVRHLGTDMAGMAISRFECVAH